ncbi:hypothetical protein Taro_009538 [Colocasia esculenta]|uniref:Receptor-like serine/threonine-protein kinase n=1 Tax=Colocasia esculenta TaxID=4460 RepID=A0A843TWJ5_COLES|nr:hypothetical protein [Colocasia esculenta]
MSLLLLLLFLPMAAVQTTPRNITTGSSLTPLGQTTPLVVSPSGDFAVGFRPLDSDNSLFLLAVWFTKVTNQTVVWAANGNHPVEAGSNLRLRADGRLVLTDSGGAEVWSATPDATDITHAAMLDNGNFVLARAGSAGYAWESFNEPMDTILPSQTLSFGRRLTSRLTESDYSDGRFQLRMEDNGNLVFYQAPPSCPIDAGCTLYDAYWDAGTVGNGQQLVVGSAGDVSVALKNGSSVTITPKKSNYPPREFYHRATLDPDGVLRHYVYARNETGGAWTVAASLPSDICVRRRYFVGSGVCGYNSYCSQIGAMQKTNCDCPPQYSFVDPARKYKGCKPDFAPQSCDADGGGGATAREFRIERMPRIDWPSTDYQHLKPVSEEQCGNACLSDCYCTVAIHRVDDCWMKRLPLLNGRYDVKDINGYALLKVARDPNSNKNNRTISAPKTTIKPPFTRRSGGRTWLLLLLGSGNCLLLAVVFFLTFCVYHKKTWGIGSSKLDINLRPFTYKELHEATQGFKEELGKGAFGTVYKGLIESDSTSTPIAVKRLQELDDAGAETEFENEVRIIAQIHHKNLVRLLGYCNEGPLRLLVYEYMCNGSLFGLLLGSTKPDWDTRVELAFGVSRGLLYLHEDCSTQIIHCDIKPQNVLIDDNFTARISDFGLSKLLRAGQSRTLTDIRGTRGYVAPEWFKHMSITSKVDVYSFGVLLLEIICCRRSVEAEAGESKAVLAYWAYDCLRAGRLEALVEDEAGPLADMRRLERLVMVALWCIQDEPSLRPTMKKVTQMLEGAVEVAVPPDPSSYTSSTVEVYL